MPKYTAAEKLRQTITFNSEQYEALRNLAQKSHVSFSWVVRYACDRLIAERSGRPLLGESSEVPDRGGTSGAEQP